MLSAHLIISAINYLCQGDNKTNKLFCTNKVQLQRRHFGIFYIHKATILKVEFGNAFEIIWIKVILPLKKLKIRFAVFADFDYILFANFQKLSQLL